MAEQGHQLTRLMAWYAAHRDDEWEHHHGIKLEPLASGGWALIIDTDGTDLAHIETEPQRIERGPDEWLQWMFEPGSFRASGSRGTMNEIITKFFDEIERLAERQKR